MTKKLSVNRCKWREDYDSNWNTECDKIFVFLDDGPSENKMLFCCYCGKQIAEVKYAMSEEMKG